MESDYPINDEPGAGAPVHGTPSTLHQGSAFDVGFYGIVQKDLRSVLRKPETDRLNRVYCGSGSLRALPRGARDLAGRGRRRDARPGLSRPTGPCAAGDQECHDSIQFRAIGAITQPLIEWVNRPTFQQADEIQGHAGGERAAAAQRTRLRRAGGFAGTLRTGKTDRAVRKRCLYSCAHCGLTRAGFPPHAAGFSRLKIAPNTGLIAMPKDVILTQEGLANLKAELDHLSTTRRREIAGRIKEAREFGDISENAEYDDAKNEQAMLEARIASLEDKLRSATVVDASDLGTDVVRVGSVVHVKDAAGKSNKYTIVGSAEAKPAEAKLSNESPVGRALIGRKRGDEVSIATPRGERKLKITKIDVGV